MATGIVPARRRIKTASEVARSLGVAVLVNHQIVSAVKAGIIEIDPFDEANVRPASIDLTLNGFVITTDGGKVDLTDGKLFVLKSGQTIIADTKEWIALPRD